MFKVLEEKPNNILEYAGKFFDQFIIYLIQKLIKRNYRNRVKTLYMT